MDSNAHEKINQQWQGGDGKEHSTFHQSVRRLIRGQRTHRSNRTLEIGEQTPSAPKQKGQNADACKSECTPPKLRPTTEHVAQVATFGFRGFGGGHWED